MKTQNRLKNLRRKGRESLSKELICIYALAMATDTRVEKAWHWAGTRWRGAMGGGVTSVIPSIIFKEN